MQQIKLIIFVKQWLSNCVTNYINLPMFDKINGTWLNNWTLFFSKELIFYRQSQKDKRNFGLQEFSLKKTPAMLTKGIKGISFLK